MIKTFFAKRLPTPLLNKPTLSNMPLLIKPSLQKVGGKDLLSRRLWDVLYDPYISPSVSLFCGAFCLGGWIAQSKDNWSVIKGSHSLDNFFSECSSHGCHTCKESKQLFNSFLPVTYFIFVNFEILTVPHSNK